MFSPALCYREGPSQSSRCCGRATTTYENSGPERPAGDRSLVEDVVHHLTATATGCERFGGAVQRLSIILIEVLTRPEVMSGLRKGMQALEVAHARIGAIDAPGYTPYFERLGHDGFMSRFHAGFVRHLGRRIYLEDRKKRVALSVIHDLAKRRRWHPAFQRQIAQLCDACSGGGMFDVALRKAGRPDFAVEFPILLQRARNGDHAMSARLLDIVAAMAPHLPSARGRPLSPAGALHQAFLRWSAEMGGRASYTYGPVPGSRDRDCKEDFTDAATLATRIELNRPCFNPIPARRAVRGRRLHDGGKRPTSDV